MKRLLPVVCAFAAVMFAQERPKTSASTALREYSYPSDGFAIKFPYAPRPHKDPANPRYKVWTVHFSKLDATISVRRIVDSRPCNVALDQLKNMAKADNVSIREFSMSGRPAWEENEHLTGREMTLERYVCGVGRYYVLTFVWPAKESRPQLGMEVMDSLRLLK